MASSDDMQFAPPDWQPPSQDDSQGQQNQPAPDPQEQEEHGGMQFAPPDWQPPQPPPPKKPPTESGMQFAPPDWQPGGTGADQGPDQSGGPQQGHGSHQQGNLEKANEAVDKGLEAAKAVANVSGNPEVAAAIEQAQLARKFLRNPEEASKEAEKKGKKYLLLLALVIGIVIGILLLVLAIFSSGTGAANVIQEQMMDSGPNNPLQISKIGPFQWPNSTNFAYTINVSYPYDAQELTITDQIDSNTQFVDSPQWKKFIVSGNTITWKLSENTPNYNGTITGPINESFTFVVKPLVKDNYVFNLGAIAQVIGASSSAGVSGDILKILPQPLPNDPPGVQNARNDVITKFKTVTSNITVYKQAASQTGIPWQVFASLHYREGAADPNQSLVSGAPIGTNEPDVVAAGGCVAAALKGPVGVADGIPEPLPGGGCGFSSLLDSALYAAKVLKGKPGGSLTNANDLITALSHYNGGGDANCNKGLTYTSPCPPPYGIDDTYVMDMFDTQHYPMFVIYCFRSQPCNPAPQDPNPGVLTVIKWVVQSGIN